MRGWRMALAWGACGMAAATLLMLSVLQQPALPCFNSALPAWQTGQPVPGRELPLIFVGGMPRSGTTLMRAMLDAHPIVRCGQETRILIDFVNTGADLDDMDEDELEYLRFEEAGVTREVRDNAVAAAILEVVMRHDKLAPRICNKDPFVLKYGVYMLRLFPQAKHIYMVRDARAVVHSIAFRGVTINDFSKTDYRKNLIQWNITTATLYEQCEQMGHSKCLMVYYEKLVLEPRETMQRVLDYLEIEWDESVLHHETEIGRQVKISAMEPSSNQIVRAIYQDALTRWVGQLPQDLLEEVPEIAPMMSKLGYDPYSTIPDYTKIRKHSLS